MLVWAPNGICDAAANILRDAGHQVMIAPMLCGRSYIVHWTRRMEPLPFVSENTTIIACPATGTEHLDAARAAGKRVLSLRDCGDLSEIRATVEFTIGAILALTRRIPGAVESVRNGEWDRMKWQGTDLWGKSALIVGCGRIGSQVHDLLWHLGMKVARCDQFDKKGDLRGLLMWADLVTVHCDLNPTSRGMFDAKAFAAMKPGSLLINTSRGGVLDEHALIAALESGHLGGAALDVLCDEPPKPDNPLIAYARENPTRLLISPHIGGCSVESLERAECLLAARLVEELKRGGS